MPSSSRTTFFDRNRHCVTATNGANYVARYNTVKDNYLATLKKAGVNWLALGIESGNTRVRKDVTKGRFEDVDIRKVVNKIREHGIHVIGNYIFGLPEDDFRRRTPNFNEPLLSRNLELVERLRAIGRRHGKSPGELAIAWTLRHPAVTAAIVGLRSAEQVRGVLGAADFQLSPGELSEIEAFQGRAAGS